MISPLAHIHPEAVIGDNCEIGPFVYIDKGVVIGANNVIMPHATLLYGTLMGSGNQVSDELHVTNHRMLFNGSVQAILRSGIDGGDVNITATCDGLKPAKIKLKVKP